MIKKDQHPGKSSIQPIPINERLPKRWVLAKRKYGHTQNQRDNETVERTFMNLVYQAKNLLKHQHQTAFSRDFRGHNETDAFVMEVFICASVYLYLECSLDYCYRIQYQFYNCHYEAEIRKLLDGYVLRNRAKEVELQPSFPQFYSKVLEVQDSKHIISL